MENIPAMKLSIKDKNLTLTLQGLSLVVTGIFSSFSSQDVLQQKLPHFQMDEVTPKIQRKEKIILLHPNPTTGAICERNNVKLN